MRFLVNIEKAKNEGSISRTTSSLVNTHLEIHLSFVSVPCEPYNPNYSREASWECWNPQVEKAKSQKQSWFEVGIKPQRVFCGLLGILLALIIWFADEVLVFFINFPALSEY